MTAFKTQHKANLMIRYPEVLQPIFNAFVANNINPVIVGGFVRDALLGVYSKDIDIELYGVCSFHDVEKILTPFGKTNNVGKNFGVCKVVYKGLDLDFSLPRTENKIGVGHKGFAVATSKNLTFKEAARRRDFTINAIGFDVTKQELLDPFGGINDLKLKLLKAVDSDHFVEDPLRILRGVVFSARFDLSLSNELFLLCKNMIDKHLLDELPKERIFSEIEKILLKTSTPSKAFYLLESLGAFTFFKEFALLSKLQRESIFKSLDTLKEQNAKDEKEFSMLGISLMCRCFHEKQRDDFLARLSNGVKLKRDVKKIIDVIKSTDFSLIDNHLVYHLASLIEIRVVILFLSSIGFNTTQSEILKTKALSLGVYTKPLVPLVEGKDLLELGFKPSKAFSLMLHEAYEAQMQEHFFTKPDALLWIKKRFL